jgi:hypothetical protein
MIPENCPLDPAHRLSISLDTAGRVLTSPPAGSDSPQRLCQTLGRQVALRNNSFAVKVDKDVDTLTSPISIELIFT